MVEVKVKCEKCLGNVVNTGQADSRKRASHRCHGFSLEKIQEFSKGYSDPRGVHAGLAQRFIRGAQYGAFGAASGRVTCTV